MSGVQAERITPRKKFIAQTIPILNGEKAEWKLREKLKEENESVPNQKGKPTKIPTMRWIFFKFQGITELFTQEEGEIESEVLNMEELHWKILGLLGEEYENMYL